MACYGSAYQKNMLDWVFSGASPTRPTSWAIALAVGTPSSISASEVATGLGLNRQQATWPAAVAAGGSISNSAALTFGTANATATIFGVTVWDTSGATGGGMIAYGALAGSRVLSSGDQISFAVGALTITLA